MKEISTIMNWELLNLFIASTQDGIQIADETGAIVFMNDTAKTRLGIQNIEQPIHVSDFEPMFKNPADWKKHVNSLKKHGVEVIRSTNIQLNTKAQIPVEVTVQIQTFKGKDYIFAISRDISRLLEQENIIEVRETMLLAISQSSTELLNNNNFFSAVSKVLQIIGKAVKVDRTYLFTCNLDETEEQVVSQRCEWNSGDVEPQIDNPDLQNVPTALFDDFIEKMNLNIPFQSIVADLPQESALKEILESQGIVSILIIPVFHKGEFWGFIGYDECKYRRVWDEVEISILQTLSNNMTAALERLDYSVQIENLAEFPLENPAPVLRINTQGQILFQNKLEQIKSQEFSRLGRNESLNFNQLLQLISGDNSTGQKIRYYEIQTSLKEFYAITAKEVENKSYINLYFSDISKLKETERQLKETRSIVDQIVNNMEDVIWSVSYPDYKALFISPSTEKLYGISSKEFYKNTQVWIDPIIEEDKAIVQQIFKDLQSKGESNYEYRIRMPEGELKWLRSKTKLMYDLDTGLPNRVDGYIMDITDQKLNQELSEKARVLAEESNLAKEEFIANMSHEIRTPLNAILGLSKQLLDESDQKDKGILKNILLSGKHLQSLVENVLDFSKISAGEFELNSIKTNLYTELQSVYSMLEVIAKEKNISFKQVFDAQLDMLVEIDSRRLKQVLINILSNSIKFTDEGLVVIHAKIQGHKQNLEVTIKDTGIGMSEQFIEKIFEKFAQEDGSPERRAQGSGLGMAITKKLVDMMGGEIKIKSSRGFGTEVVLVLPFKQLPSHSDGSTQQLHKDYKHFKDKHVLIVEDNEINAIVVRNSLQRFGMKSTISKNGLEALENLKINKFDLVLMDLQMPVMGGLIATGIIRKDLKLDMPIIGLSANALQSSRIECLAAGMNDFITKPFEDELLFDVLSKYLIETKDKGNYYDLSNYSSTEENNHEHLIEIVDMFVQMLPSYIQEMEEALPVSDFKKIKQIAHKVKPNLLMFGAGKCKEDIIYLNYFDENDKNEIPNVKDRLSSLATNVKELCTELRKDYL